MNYCDGLFAHTKEIRNKIALIDLNDGQTLTYGKLQDRIRNLASWFLNQGIILGDTIGIHLHNSLEAVIVHMAAQYIGAVSCLIDPLAQPKSLNYYIDETKCRLFITHIPRISLSPELFSLTKIIVSGELDAAMEGPANDDLPAAPVGWDEKKISYIYFTSGTTSQPKGVTLAPSNHKNFFSIRERYWQPVDENSRHICFVPFSHAFGSIFLIPLALNTGAQLYILRSFQPIKVLESIARDNITHIYGVPSHYQQLLRLPQAGPVLSKIKLAFCAAAKLEHQVMQEWKNVTGTYLNEGYGLIETTGGIVWRVGEEPRGTGHVGVIPDPDLIEVGTMDETGKHLDRGQIGEIIVRGKSVMQGYLNRPQENERVFVDGWFRTGDQGYISDDNHLFITGRVKDIINVAGIKISPFEVEEVLNRHPAVAQAIAVAADDKLYGEVVKVFALLKNGASATEREIIKYASGYLINFQVPKEIRFIEQFPVNSMGKIDRKKLQIMINSD